MKSAIVIALMVVLSAVAVAGPVKLRNDPAIAVVATAKGKAQDPDASVTWADILDQQQAAANALDAIDISPTGKLGIAVSATSGATKTALTEVRKTLSDVRTALRKSQTEARRLVRKLRATEAVEVAADLKTTTRKEKP